MKLIATTNNNRLREGMAACMTYRRTTAKPPVPGALGMVPLPDHRSRASLQPSAFCRGVGSFTDGGLHLSHQVDNGTGGS